MTKLLKNCMSKRNVWQWYPADCA